MPKLISTNPSKNYNKIGEMNISSDEEIKEKVLSANKAKLRWKELGINKRIEHIRPLRKLFEIRANEIALMISREIGKPISQSTGEVVGSLKTFDWLLENGPIALKNKTTHEDKNSIHQTAYEPWGVAAVITPWNYPFSIFLSNVISNLIAGNTTVFKISEECPLTGKIIEEIMSSADLPEGVFSEIYGSGDIGKKLSDCDIDLICFTGSTKAGKYLYKKAADKFIKSILEMGGSSPCIVFEDADLNSAIPKIFKGRYSNCGQVCDAIKRLIVHKSLFHKTVEALNNEIEKYKVGNPESPETDMGPLVAKRQLDLLQEQVEDAKSKGARIICGGKGPKDLIGAFYEPTVMTDIKTNMKVWREEVFGPVLPIISFESEEEAIRLANDTRYGLGSRVFSEDKDRALRVASKINAGTVEINLASRWIKQNPFGGYKESGMGRQSGYLGLRELCQVKVISQNK